MCNAEASATIPSDVLTCVQHDLQNELKTHLVFVRQALDSAEAGDPDPYKAPSKALFQKIVRSCVCGHLSACRSGSSRQHCQACLAVTLFV